jgi:hypothetical protein
MKQYISKSDLVAEIDKGINGRNDWQLDDYRKGYHDALTMLKKYLSILKAEEVGLEKEIQDIHKCFHDYYGIVNSDTGEFAKVEDMVQIAKHFFELGLKSKGE